MRRSRTTGGALQAVAGESRSSLPAAGGPCSVAPTGPSRRDRISAQARGIGLMVLGYLAVSVVAFWPLVRHPRSQYWADGGDGATFIWSYWALPRALLDGRSPFTTTEIFHPVGAHLAYATNVPLVSVLSWPLQRVLGLAATSVVIGLFALVSSAVGAHLLARKAGCGRGAAAFAGLAYLLVPWRTNRVITHLNLIHTEFIAFSLLAALALYERPSRTRAALLGSVMGLALLTDLNLAVLSAVPVVILALYRHRDTIRREVALRLAGSVAVALVVASPALVALAGDAGAGEIDAPRSSLETGLYSTDLLSWLLPHPEHPLWGSPFRAVHDRAAGGERFAYLGVVVALLVLVGLWRGRRRGLWVTIAVSTFVLALGPGLRVNGWTGSRFRSGEYPFSIPLPFLLITKLPGAGAFRVPARLAAVASLAAIVLAALGLDALVRTRARRSRLAVLGVACVLLALDFLPPRRYLTLPVATDPAYAAMAADPEPGAVLDIPLQFRTGTDRVGGADIGPLEHSRFMALATLHRRPMAGGTVARLPDRRLEELLDIGVYRDVLRLQGDIDDGVAPSFDAEDLRRLGILFVVIHHESPAPAAADHFRGLGLTLFADDADVTVWRVP